LVAGENDGSAHLDMETTAPARRRGLILNGVGKKNDSRTCTSSNSSSSRKNGVADRAKRSLILGQRHPFTPNTDRFLPTGKPTLRRTL